MAISPSIVKEPSSPEVASQVRPLASLALIVAPLMTSPYTSWTVPVMFRATCLVPSTDTLAERLAWLGDVTVTVTEPLADCPSPRSEVEPGVTVMVKLLLAIPPISPQETFMPSTASQPDTATVA